MISFIDKCLHFLVNFSVNSLNITPKCCQSKYLVICGHIAKNISSLQNSPHTLQCNNEQMDTDKMINDNAINKDPTMYAPEPDVVPSEDPGEKLIENPNEKLTEKLTEQQHSSTTVSVRIKDVQKLQDLAYLAHAFRLIDKNSTGEYIRYCAMTLGFEKLRDLYDKSVADLNDITNINISKENPPQ